MTCPDPRPGPLPKVYVCRRLPAAALHRLAGRCRLGLWDSEEPVPPEVLREAVGEADGLLTTLTDRIDAALLDRAPNLRVVSNFAVGYDNVDVAACTARGIVVTNTPGVLTEATADLAFALLLAAARRLPEAERFLRAGRWTGWKPMELAGVDVHGATLGIVGFGRIGRAVARRARGFDMRVLYWNRTPRPEAAAETGAEHRPLDDLLRESDFVSVHCALTSETRGLIGERELGLMKPSAILVNTARGAVVDEAALHRALAAGRLRAAGLDVYAAEPIGPDHPLLALDNVVALPHIGSATEATRTRMAVLAAENLLAVLAGRRPEHLVNPEAWGDAARDQGD